MYMIPKSAYWIYTHSYNPHEVLTNAFAPSIPCSSQYGWRGSEMSMGDCVLDSGKASDLSVCSWPVEPIQWTPFPLLQQLASHRTPTVSLCGCACVFKRHLEKN